jgi:hypothetical protein
MGRFSYLRTPGKLPRFPRHLRGTAPGSNNIDDEHAIFLAFLWNTPVIDTREQFPLDYGSAQGRPGLAVNMRDFVRHTTNKRKTGPHR